MRAAGDSSPAFVGWCLAGAAACFGVISLLTIGPFILLGTLFLCAWLLSRFNFGWAMGGLLTGAAVPVVYVAWLNRDGPGEVCTHTATSTSCDNEWSPWPFLVAAVVLVVAGILVFLRRRSG